MKLLFQCDCGNQTNFFAIGDTDELGRETLEVEDDERLRIVFGETGLMFICNFCKQTYIIDKNVTG
ncbi:hypothetical protein [Paenibacillus abyssi]|uniref:Uncharacterized protein n=1 Tax=Paenibacillus abyssi TaxID=1340531 RepID=A0A917FMG2_9BACL|nr:hypothetical protein [Paenibacillus abyssi]GGF89389.1 hypothetical protein GCM10010916_03410 [Paenibacillus abyssi]